jgi:hypothetical protein
VLTFGFTGLKVALHVEHNLPLHLVKLLQLARLQRHDLLVLLVHYLPQLLYLCLALRHEHVEVVACLFFDLVYLCEQRVVVSREPLPVLPLHWLDKEIQSIRLVQLAPDPVGVGFYLGEGFKDLLEGEVDNAVGIGA